MSYFTDDYAEHKDTTMRVGRVGARKLMSIPLGLVKLKDRIDFSRAKPKPKLRETESARRENTADIEEEPKSKKKSKRGISFVMHFFFQHQNSI